MAEIEESADSDKDKYKVEDYIGWNQNQTPLPNYNFMLRVELAIDLPLKSVRAFTREMEYDLIQEGGLNDYVHMRRKGVTKPFFFEIERYVGISYVDVLPVGGNFFLPLLLIVGIEPNQFIPFYAGRTYAFSGCTVMKKTYGDLIADTSGLLVETITIAYRELFVVDNSMADMMPILGSSAPSMVGTTLQEENELNGIKAKSQQYMDQINQDYNGITHAQGETARLEGLLEEESTGNAEEIAEKKTALETGSDSSLSLEMATQTNQTVQKVTITEDNVGDKVTLQKAQENCNKLETAANHFRSEKEAVDDLADQTRQLYLAENGDGQSDTGESGVDTEDSDTGDSKGDTGDSDVDTGESEE